MCRTLWANWPVPWAPCDPARESAFCAFLLFLRRGKQKRVPQRNGPQIALLPVLRPRRIEIICFLLQSNKKQYRHRPTHLKRGQRPLFQVRFLSAFCLHSVFSAARAAGFRHCPLFFQPPRRTGRRLSFHIPSALWPFFGPDPRQFSHLPAQKVLRRRKMTATFLRPGRTIEVKAVK